MWKIRKVSIQSGLELMTTPMIDEGLSGTPYIYKPFSTCIQGTGTAFRGWVTRVQLTAVV